MVGLARGTVELEPHRPEWRRQYEREVERLRACLGDDAPEFEHARHAARLVPILEAHGYEHRPNDGVPDRVFLAKGPRTNRTHYLSLTEAGSDCYRESVRFRDYLRTHSAVAAEYDRLKRELADEHEDDRPTYTKMKDPFVRRVLDRAAGEREP